ncbi:hypothetical protein V535_02450, partial [Staphylococcus aureus F19955]
TPQEGRDIFFNEDLRKKKVLT